VTKLQVAALVLAGLAILGAFAFVYLRRRDKLPTPGTTTLEPPPKMN
jgi:LPXTG-motif cell wall-anchored protein